MKLRQIEQAIKSLCHDVEELVTRHDYRDMTEMELAYELIICILGSGVRYEVCLGYANCIKSKNLVSKKKVLNHNEETKFLLEKLLSSPVKSYFNNATYKKYRYPNRGSDHLSRAFYNIYSEYGSLNTLINSVTSSFELRRELIKLCPGIGPKQSSHFIKNIGYTDEVAILDRHILKYLELYDGNEICRKQIGKIDYYERIEQDFISIASKFEYSVSVVDQSMWFIMRELGKKEVYV